MTTKLLLSVPYGQPLLDFQELLARFPSVIVKRRGPSRRAQVEVPDGEEETLRQALPSSVRIEPVKEYSQLRAG